MTLTALMRLMARLPCQHFDQEARRPTRLPVSLIISEWFCTCPTVNDRSLFSFQTCHVHKNTRTHTHWTLMHPSRGNKSSHCPSHGEVISAKGWQNRPATHYRTTNQIAVVCLVKSKQTSKSVFYLWLYGATVPPFKAHDTFHFSNRWAI